MPNSCSCRLFTPSVGMAGTGLGNIRRCRDPSVVPSPRPSLGSAPRKGVIGRGVTGDAVGMNGVAAGDVSLWGLRIGMKTESSSFSWTTFGLLGINFLGFSSSKKGKLSCKSTMLLVAGKLGKGEGPGGSGAGAGVGLRVLETSLESFLTPPGNF